MEMQQSGGLLQPPVQTLVATIIFAPGKDANESLLLRQKKTFCRPRQERFFIEI